MSVRLRELFEERSAAEPAGVVHGARPAAVHRRIARARRWRATAAGATVLAVVAAVATVSAGVRGSGQGTDPTGVTPVPEATPTGKTIEGFPEYANGARVVAAASASLPDKTATLRFVPRTLDLMVFTRCDPPEIWADPVINGHTVTGGCGNAIWFPEPPEKHWGWLDVRVGKPSTIVLTATRSVSIPNRRIGSLPASGTFAVAIAERLPFAEYPLPPRPDTLPPLPGGGPDVITTVRNAPGDPLARRTVKVGWRSALHFVAQMQTPGTLRVLLDGRQFIECMKWDYSATSRQPSQIEMDNGCVEERILSDNDNPGKPGDVVTITVMPENVTGDWAVRITK